MKHISKLLGAASLATLAALTADPAFAAGTASGSLIQNTVSVSYQVSGITQTGTSASDTFTVDRKVNLTVAEVGTTTTTVTPGQTSAVTTFQVSNLSNATLDFALSVAQASGGTAAHGGTDNFDASNVRIYLETGTTAGFSGDDQLVTYLDELAADGIKTVYVVVDIPLSRSTGDVAGVTLTATGRESGGTGSLGTGLTQTSGANTSGVDTVFADGAGATDSARNADYSASDDYTIYAAAITAAKTSRIVTDGYNSFPNAKAIPGATVEYCIKISNAAGGASASNVAISDTLPSEVAYDSSFGILLNGTVDGSGNCQADGTSGGSESGGVVSGTLSSVAAGATRTLLFRATIQ